MTIATYPSIFAIGHRAIADIFNGPVVVQEKVDGSQFSMMRAADGTLHCRSKGRQIDMENPDQMFRAGVRVADSLNLHPDWIYRGEYLERPKHNTLAYSRIPKEHIVLFDVQTGLEQYLTPPELQAEAERLGLECVPNIYNGVIENAEQLFDLLKRESFLGGAEVEGVVVKNYAVFTHEKKVSMGKFVSEAFKEVHNGDWKERNPTRTDVVAALISSYRTEARWRKAVEHLRDAGLLEGSPRDIGKLIHEIPDDILKDSEADIKEALFKYFWPQLKRGITAGFPEFYKKYLVEGSFNTNGETTESVAA